jgi:hypothetical protein
VLQKVLTKSAKQEKPVHTRKAVAESKRVAMEEEARAELDKLKAEAAKRKGEGGRAAGRGRPKQVPQQIWEPNERHERETPASVPSPPARTAATWRPPLLSDYFLAGATENLATVAPA